MFESKYRAILTGAALLLLLTGLASLSGCGGGDETVVLARVGDREITADYYQDRLARLAEVDLPRNEAGETVDPETLAGKRAFLDVIINKDVMVLKADDLGYDEVKEYETGRRFFSQYMAKDVMTADLITVSPDEVTDADIEDYYRKRKQKRHFQFIICNFRDDALEARQKIIDGGLWSDVARDYNDGSSGPNGDYTMSLQYGMVKDVFEQAVFSIGMGEISMPIESVYGYWLVRLTDTEEVRDRPLDEAYRDRIRRIIAQRRTKLKEKAFYDESLVKHEFFMDEGVLWSVFQGLPEQERFLDPETNEPIPKAQLAPLDVPVEESDRVFFSCRFDLDEEPDVWTLGRYKAKFAEMSTFQRPKKNKMLGGVRQKIMADMIYARLIMSEAEERGYLEDPRVVAEVNTRLEELLLDRLHDDVVTYEEKVTSAQIEEFWADHKDEFKTAEQREGYLMLCKTEPSAEAAYEALQAGMSWDEAYTKFSANPEDETKGALTVARTRNSPVRDAAFDLESVGETTPVFANGQGWSLFKLESIIPSAQKTMAESSEVIGQRIRMKRKDASLKALLEQWRQEYEIEVDEDALASMPTWSELRPAE